MANECTANDALDTQRKRVSLYDAVAGRVGYEGFLTEQRPSKYRDTASTSTAPVPPEEILFRRKSAPSRYIEDDVYSADRHLQAHQCLPDSDLVKSIHAYTADCYGASRDQSTSIDFRSLDETALLAIGILLEEAAEHQLGKSGDLALVERMGHSDEIGGEKYWYDGQWKRNVIRGARGERRSAWSRSPAVDDHVEAPTKPSNRR